MLRTTVCLSTVALAAALPSCVFVVDAGDHVTTHESRRDTPRIGVDLSDVSSATAAQAGVDNSRACIITAVSSGSSADRAGLQKYDIITHIDGRDYATVSALREAVRARRPGETLSLTITRAGRSQDVTVTVTDD